MDKCPNCISRRLKKINERIPQPIESGKIVTVASESYECLKCGHLFATARQEVLLLKNILEAQHEKGWSTDASNKMLAYCIDVLEDFKDSKDYKLRILGKITRDD